MLLDEDSQEGRMSGTQKFTVIIFEKRMLQNVDSHAAVINCK